MENGQWELLQFIFYSKQSIGGMTMSDKRKLLFLDIDGTLTPAGSNNPPESAMKAIRAAQAAGHMYSSARAAIRTCSRRC